LGLGRVCVSFHRSRKRQNPGLSNSKELLLLLPLPFLSSCGGGGRVWGEREDEGRGGFFRQGRGSLRSRFFARLSSIIAAIITKQAWVCISKPRAAHLPSFLSWCRSGRPAPVRRGVLSFYGGGVVTLSLLCRFDSVSLWGNCSRFGFPFFTFFDELIEGFHRILPVSVSSCSWKTSTSSLFFFSFLMMS